MATNRLFADDVPTQVVQNLVTALDPSLLTEHTVMLLFHDLTKLMPMEEMPRRLLEVLMDYFEESNEDAECSSTH